MHCPPVEGVGEGEGEGDLGTVQVQEESEAQVPALILAAQQAAGTRRCAEGEWTGGVHQSAGIHPVQCKRSVAAKPTCEVVRARADALPAGGGGRRG